MKYAPEIAAARGEKSHDWRRGERERHITSTESCISETTT